MENIDYTLFPLKKTIYFPVFTFRSASYPYYIYALFTERVEPPIETRRAFRKKNGRSEKKRP